MWAGAHNSTPIAPHLAARLIAAGLQAALVVEARLLNGKLHTKRNSAKMGTVLSQGAGRQACGSLQHAGRRSAGRQTSIPFHSFPGQARKQACGGLGRVMPAPAVAQNRPLALIKLT